jgi:hypothetical protein
MWGEQVIQFSQQRPLNFWDRLHIVSPELNQMYESKKLYGLLNSENGIKYLE